MVKIENDCVGCSVPAYPCLGSACPYRNVKHYYCDNCNDEVEEGELYQYGNEQLCLDCIKNDLEVVK